MKKIAIKFFNTWSTNITFKLDYVVLCSCVMLLIAGLYKLYTSFSPIILEVLKIQ